jgi:hypothetical protein
VWTERGEVNEARRNEISQSLLHAKYYKGFQIKKEETDGAFIINSKK